jgi:transposase-like protein
MGVSRRTVLKWLTRYEAEGEAGLQDRSSRPHQSPNRLPRSRVKAIRRLRKRKWTSSTIARHLSIPRSTVGVWLRQLGMGRLRDLEPKEKPVRYERSRPGELLHLDTKKLGRIGRIGHRIHGDYRRRARGVGWEFLHVCVDDATRTLLHRDPSRREGHHGGDLHPAGGSVVRGPWRHGGANHDGQRQRIRLASLRPATREAGDPAHPHPTVSTSDQREGRTLHPDRDQGVGLRSSVPNFRAQDRCPHALPEALSWAA